MLDFQFIYRECNQFYYAPLVDVDESYLGAVDPLLQAFSKPLIEDMESRYLPEEQEDGGPNISYKTTNKIRLLLNEYSTLLYDTDY